MSWHISKALMDNYENSPSSQEQAAGYLAGNSLDGELSVPSKSNPTPQAYLHRGSETDVSPHFLFSTT